MSAVQILSEVADLVMGQSPPSTSYNETGEGLPFYQGKSEFGATYPTPRKYCTDPKKLAKAGDILMSVRAPVGTTNLCKEKSCIGRGIAAIRAKGIDRDYLYFYLRKIEPYIDSLGSGAIFKAINKSQLSELPINEAGIELPEQKKIAYILSTVQRAIEAQERIIQTTTELKKALMQKLFTEGLRNEPQKQTEIGLVPESWEVVEIGDVFKFTSGKTKPKGTISTPTDEQNIPVYGGNGVLGYSSQYLLEESTLSLGRVGEYCGCSHLTTPIAWVTDNALYAKEEKLPVNLTYIRNHFEYLNLNKYSNKMGQPLIPQGIINRVKFAFPTRDDQEDLAKVFETLDKRIKQISIKKTAFQDLFRTLLHELMTAKIRVHELELADLKD